jgi:bifunctional N6-L-threonylcarbamoyladenine synthase / protein kinase Bud32
MLIYMKMIAKGAEAEIFEEKYEGKNAMLKKRVKKRYRLEQLDVKLRTFRTKREAKILFAAKLAGILCPKLLGVDLKKTELVLEKIIGKNLRDIMNGKDAKKAGKYIIDAGKALSKLHTANIVHGDYSTANIMILPSGEVCIIDFGLSDFTSSDEAKATDLLVFKKSVDEKQFLLFVKGYYANFPDSNRILNRLNDIESRGRYVSRSQ